MFSQCWVGTSWDRIAAAELVQLSCRHEEGIEAQLSGKFLGVLVFPAEELAGCVFTVFVFGLGALLRGEIPGAVDSSSEP